MTRWARWATPWVCTSLLLGCSKPGYDSEPAASEGGARVEEHDPPQSKEGDEGDAKPEHPEGPPPPAKPGDNVVENTQPEKNLANQPGYEYAPGKGPSAPPRDAGPNDKPEADTGDDD